ncbi:hypothetical protein QTP88_008328 [Uroleucon formosanum]
MLLPIPTSRLAMSIRICSRIGAETPMAVAAAKRPHSVSLAPAAVAYLGHTKTNNHWTDLKKQLHGERVHTGKVEL